MSSSTASVSGPFLDFLNEAARKVEEGFPGAAFYSGIYQPNIINFHYSYIFGTPETGIQVSVNTFDGQAHVLSPTRIPPVTHLQPISLPISYSLEDAYLAAEQKGYHPNVDGATVFLENSTVSADQYPSYWMLDGNSNRWIEVSIEPPHDPVITTKQPVQPS